MPPSTHARRFIGLTLLALAAVAATTGRPAAQAPAPFTLDDILSYPFPDNLIAAPGGQRRRLDVQRTRQRNIYVADGARFRRAGA